MGGANGDYTGIQCQYTPLYFKGLSANATLAQEPQPSAEKFVSLRYAILKRWKRQRKTPNKLQTTYPEQG